MLSADCTEQIAQPKTDQIVPVKFMDTYNPFCSNKVVLHSCVGVGNKLKFLHQENIFFTAIFQLQSYLVPPSNYSETESLQTHFSDFMVTW